MTVLTTRRLSATLASAIAALALALSSAALSPPKAEAGYFCQGVTLNPYGQGGDRCWGPSVPYLYYSDVRTTNRAGCATIADNANNLLTSWVCGPAGSEPGIAAWTSLFNGGGLPRKAVIRNNNTNNQGTFKGGYNCHGGSC